MCYKVPMPINVNVLQSTYAHKCKCVTKYLCPQMHMCYKIPTPTNTSTKWTTATEPCPSHLDLLNHTNGKPRGHESKGQAHHQRGREGSVVKLGPTAAGPGQVVGGDGLRHSCLLQDGCCQSVEDGRQGVNGCVVVLRCVASKVAGLFRRKEAQH